MFASRKRREVGSTTVPTSRLSVSIEVDVLRDRAGRAAMVDINNVAAGMHEARSIASAFSTWISQMTDISDKDPRQITAFDLAGGEARVHQLVDRFYDLMDLEPEFAELRAMHPPTLDDTRDKLFWFLCGWLGGPDHYVSRFGHPCLRSQHLPYAIASADRDQWVKCMAMAMEQTGLPGMLRERLHQSFFEIADWMRNRAD